MRFYKISILIVFFLLTLNLSGQIVIERNEIPQDVGTEWIKNSKDSVSVNLGSSGGPRTWNFTSQPMGGENGNLLIVDPLQSPYIDSFPGANLVYSSPADTDTVYQYYTLNNNYLILLGLGGASGSSPFFWKYDPSDSIPLPQSYGDSYSYRYGSIYEVDSGNYTEHLHYGFQNCDAYGTVNIPYGSYPCLRICGHDTVTMTVYVSNVPVLYDTTTYITYQFVTEDYGAVVCLKSYPGETNPDFTEAYILERLTYFSSGLEEPDHLNNLNCHHHPRLFSNYVTIEYSLPEVNQVKLKIYDATGRPVRTLVNHMRTEGNYSSRWYGKTDTGQSLPSGIYYYQLQAGSSIYTDKIILVK